MRYLIDPATPDDLPILIGAHTGERIGKIPAFGLVEADLRGRRLNPCDETCRVEIEPVLAQMGLTLKDLCSRPRGPQKPQKPVEVAPLASHGLSAELVEQGTRRLLLQAAIPEPLIAGALPEIVGARLGQPDHTVLCAFTADAWTLGATKKVAAGIRALEKATSRAAIVEFAPLTVPDPEEQAYNVESLTRLASVTTDAVLTRDGQEWPVIAGAQTTVLVSDASGLQRLPARYVLAPFGAILPSNDPENFAPSAGYPPELQERDYRTDQHERLKVIRNGDNWEKSLVLNSNPDAVNGPPITDAEGRVLGGNSRAMSMMRYAARNPETYADALRQALRDHCAAFGLEGVRADLDQLMLVRVVEGVTDPRTISRALNRSLTLELGKGAASVTMGKLIPISVLEQLAGDVSDSTLREILRDKSDEIIGALRKSGFITPQNSPNYVTRTNELTTRAVTDIEDALVGLVVQSTELYNLLRPKLLQLVTRIAPALVAIESFEAYAEDIADARAALADANAFMALTEPQLLAETQTFSMFGEVERASLKYPAVARWCLWWMQAVRGPVVAARTLSELVRMAQTTAEGPDMFGAGVRDAAGMIEALDMQLFAGSVPEDWREYIDARIPFRPLSPQPSLFGRRGNPSHVPPLPVRQAAARALDVRETMPPSQRGGTPVGLARARDLSNGRPVSVETAQRMARYFARHEGDKRGATWDQRGKGWQAWHMWGGDAGRAWADDVVRRDNPPAAHNDVDMLQASSELDVINRDMQEVVGACYVSRDWKQARFSHAYRNLHHAAYNVALFMGGGTFEYKEIGDNTAIGLFILPEKVEIPGRGEYNQRLFALYMRDLLLRFARMGSEKRRGITRTVKLLPDMTERFSEDYADELPTMRCMRLDGVEALLVWPWFPMGKGEFQYTDAALFFRPEAHFTDVERFANALQAQTGVDLSMAAREREAAARDLTIPSQLKLLLPLNSDVFAAFNNFQQGFTPEERAQVFLENSLSRRGPVPITLNARVAITLPGKTQLVRYDLLQVLYMKVRGVRDNTWVARFKRSADDDVQHVTAAKPAAPEIAPEPVAPRVAKVPHRERVFGSRPAPAPERAPEIADASQFATAQTLPERIAPTESAVRADFPDLYRALERTPAKYEHKRAIGMPERKSAPTPKPAKPERKSAPTPKPAKPERKRADDDGPRALQRTAKRTRREYTAEDIPNDAPRDARDYTPPNTEAIRPQVVRSVLRGVGAWAAQHETAEIAQMGPILLALADELRLAQVATRRGVATSDQMFAHMYWAAHNPQDPDAYQRGLHAATHAAILLAQGKYGEAANMLQPRRRANPLPLWADTLLQLARLVTALSAANAAGIGINSALVSSDTLLPPEGAT